MREAITKQGDSVSFGFRLDATAPPTDIDAAILQNARSFLSDGSRWSAYDSTDMALAPTRGFSWCRPAARQSLFCAVYFASLEIAGDYAHFRPAINAVRATLSDEEYQHPLVDFNNDSTRSLGDVLAVLDSALGIIHSSRRHAIRTSNRQTDPCDRECLRLFVDDYLEAILDRDSNRVPFAQEVRATENGMDIPIGAGLWTTTISIRPNRLYLLDPDSGGAAVQGVVQEADGDAVFLLRLKIRRGLVTEVETLVTRRDDTNFFAPRKVLALLPLDYPIPAPERHSRDELVRLAEGYLTALHTQGTPDYVRAALAPSATRYENGVLTTNVSDVDQADVVGWSATQQFDRGVFAGRNVVERRYPVVDVQNGLILGFAVFRPGPDTPVLLLSEIFKAQGGHLQDIRAVMLNRPPGASMGWPN